MGLARIQGYQQAGVHCLGEVQTMEACIRLQWTEGPITQLFVYLTNAMTAPLDS